MNTKPCTILTLFLFYTLLACGQLPVATQADVIKYHIKSIIEFSAGKGKRGFKDTLSYKTYSASGSPVYDREPGDIYTYKYDDRNNLLKREYFSTTRKRFSLWWFDVYERDGAGRDTVKKHFFIWGNLRPDDKKEDDVYESGEERRKYDEAGNVTKYGYYDGDGKMVHTIGYTYDNKGRVLTEKTMQGSNIFRDFAFEYDSAGNITKETTYNSGNRSFGNSDAFVEGQTRVTNYEYKYDSKKRATEKRLFYNNEKRAYFLWQYAYYNNDSLSEATMQAVRLSGGRYKKWLYPDRTQRISFTTGNSPGNSSTYVFDTLLYHKYDERGNEIIYISHDDNSVLDRPWDEEYTTIGASGKPQNRHAQSRQKQLLGGEVAKPFAITQYFTYYRNGLIKCIKTKGNKRAVVFEYSYY